MSELSEQIMDIRAAKKEIDRLNKRIAKLEQALERIADDYDCDEDAHKYHNGDGCRCCDAAKALGRG